MNVMVNLLLTGFPDGVKQSTETFCPGDVATHWATWQELALLVP